MLTTVLCLEIKENFPFSNFPMYSYQKPETVYYYLTDADGQPLATRRVSRLTTTRIKKMMGQELKRIAKERGIERGDLPPADHDLAAAAVLRDLRTLGLHEPGRRQTPLAQPVALVTVNVALADGRIVKTARELAREQPAAGPPD